MSGTAGKFRAIFFAAIMVTSMIAAGVAFTGNAAAANTAANSSSIDPSVVDAGSTNNHTVTLEGTDINASSGNTTIFSVGFDNPSAVDLSSTSVETLSVTGDANVSGTNVDQANGVVNITLNGTGTNPDDITVEANLTDVTASDSSGVSNLTFGIDHNADGDFDDTANSDSTPVDFATLTVGQGNAQTEGTFVRAKALDLNGDPVTTDGTGVGIDFVNSSSSSNRTVAANVPLNSQGQTPTVNIEAGQNYTAVLNGSDETQLASSSTVNIPDGETNEIDVTVQRLRLTDELTVVNADPDGATTGVDEDVQFDVLANDTNSQSSGPTGPVSGEDVSATIVSASNETAASIDDTPKATNSSGIASFNVTSTAPQTVTVQFNKTSDPSVNTTAEATFGPVRGNNTISGQVRTNDTEQFSGATVYAAAPGSNQSLSFSEETRPFAVDTTTESGDYVLEDLQPDTPYNVYVVADEFNRIPENQTASEITGFVAKNQTVTTGADGDTTTADLVIEPSDAVFEYELDLTLTDASPDESSTLSDKSARIPSSGSVTAEVDVDRRRVGSNSSFEDAPAGVSVDIEPTSAGILDPNSQTVDTEPDSSGTATVSLDGQTAGTSNITANVTNVEDTDYSTNDSEQAQVEVFGIAEITGQVVNEDQQALSGGQANVTLEVENSTAGGFEPTGREVQIDDDGRYNFLNVESGQSYRLTASTEGGDTGSAVIDNISTGTTTRDIVVVGAEPLASVAFDNETAASGETTVTVDSADLPDGGFVVIHDANLTAGAGAVESVIGNSVYLEPGVNEDVEITLDRELTENQTLVAMAHRDTDGDETFDFVSSDGSTDGPYTAQGQAVTDSAEVTITESSLDEELARFDDAGDGDGIIDRDEAVGAIVAYNTDDTIGGEEVTRDQAVEVIVAYNTGQTVAA